MNGSTKAAAVALGLMAGLAVPAAKADVIFDFVQTGYTLPPNTLYPGASFSASGQLVVTDADYAAGYTIRNYQVDGVRTVAMTEALRGLSFAIGGDRVTTNNFNFESNFLGLPRNNYRSILEITAAPFSAPTGTIVYSNTITVFSFNLQGAVGSGLGGSRGTGPCVAPGCGFTTATVQSVPEPTSIALFGAGLLGLAGAVRRRKV